ncbi:predicted protein [Histoplasma capsulatum H143]|uniref:Uncharacterized protein n=1 Tax=Ajellomyces capsulatus (strain H143) TaxID=544712 RepID=C6HB02_AJECH|nr:predicted protein [Histoplasma capsulatum H143]
MVCAIPYRNQHPRRKYEQRRQGEEERGGTDEDEMLKKLKLTINIRGEETWKEESKGRWAVTMTQCVVFADGAVVVDSVLVSSSNSEGCVDLGQQKCVGISNLS